MNAKKAKSTIKKQYKYKAAYNKRAYKGYSIRYHIKNDADVIAWMDVHPNKAEAIRELIKQDIAKSKK